MPRLLTSSRTLIPLFAACLIALLSSTPWGELYATLRSFGQEQSEAHVSVEGFNQPKVTIAVGSRSSRDDAEKIIRIRLEDRTEVDATIRGISLPSTWALMEVSGVHIRDIRMTDATGLRQRYAFPSVADATLTFRTRENFHAIAFGHDSPSPALLDVRYALLGKPSTQRSVQIVRNSLTVPLLNTISRH